MRGIRQALAWIKTGLHAWSLKSGGWVQSVHCPRVEPSRGRVDACTHGCVYAFLYAFFVRVLFWEIFALNIWCFAKNIIFAALYGLLVTYLVAHRFTLGNPVLAIPIIYLLRVI